MENRVRALLITGSQSGVSQCLKAQARVGIVELNYRLSVVISTCLRRNSYGRYNLTQPCPGSCSLAYFPPGRGPLGSHRLASDSNIRILFQRAPLRMLESKDHLQI